MNGLPRFPSSGFNIRQRTQQKRRKVSGAMAGEQRLLSAIAVALSSFGLATLLIVLVQDIFPPLAGSALSRYELRNHPALGYARPSSSLRSDSEVELCDGSTGDTSLQCLFEGSQNDNQCTIAQASLSPADMEVARIAWKYFKNNYNEETGLVNSVHGYPSTTMWDTGSALAAFIAARDFGFIAQKEFDDATMKLINSLQTMELFEDAAPTKCTTRTHWKWSTMAIMPSKAASAFRCLI